MDWFHCNHCFKKSGSNFAVSSCGHISCEACIKSKQCSTCGVACSYLPITDQMKPQEKVFFMDPGKLIQARMENISQVCPICTSSLASWRRFHWSLRSFHTPQIAIFQQKQMERVMVHFKTKSAELERLLEEVSQQGHRQLSELKRENSELKKQLSELKRENGELKKQLLELQRETAELKKPLSQRRVSPGQFQTTGAQRVSLPVGVTSPVTPRSRALSNVGSGETQRWSRDRGISLTTPGSIASASSHSSLHEFRTSPSFGTPTRTQTPGFQFPFMNGISLHSPRQ
ncbi:PREDICTED: RING finger protein 212B isoform X1 [Poecilia mexicana]|uniref:RING finger protein 212B isoform X1 n=1 Tax=Poecilia mexicana TaxID=48701 RepID=UPI00072E5121|nr:PREDICTED: RING finger protein 212B isoform X1 [Poecilia mexicana]